jgi:CheY-like chemotaxis protein
VLIVEDNVDAAETLRMLLELHGHEARVSYDAGSALTTAAQFHPDALLLDIGLPDMSGRELVAILRSRPETSGALILAVSGYGSQADIDASRAAGFDQHLVKPVSPEALEAALAARGATR